MEQFHALSALYNLYYILGRCFNFVRIDIIVNIMNHTCQLIMFITCHITYVNKTYTLFYYNVLYTYIIMIDRETPLAEIVGQMLLSKNTDVSTQSWVFISVNDDLT